jgi:hypothetical protein
MRSVRYPSDIYFGLTKIKIGKMKEFNCKIKSPVLQNEILNQTKTE